MKYKLYKAIDKRGKEESCFLVRQDGYVATSEFSFGDSEELRLNKKCCLVFSYEEPCRFNDAINPILIGEFEV